MGTFLFGRKFKIYTLIIKDKNGNKINEITNHQGFSYNFELNRAGSCDIKPNINFGGKFTMANLYPYQSYLDIYRHNVKVWGGFLNKISGDVGPVTGDMTLNFAGYLKLLEKMYIGPLGETYTGIDQGTILWTMLNNYQLLPNGDFGITCGDVTTGIVRDRTYSAFKNIYDAFIEMTEVINGCDIEITAEKIFNSYAHKGHRLLHVFEYGKNINNFSFSINGDTIQNYCVAVGSGEDTDLLYSPAHNIQSQEKYGLLQGIIQKSDVNIVDTLTEYAQSSVKENGEPVSIFSLNAVVTNDPPLMGYLVGDEIRCIVKKGWVDFDTYKRIKKISVNVDTEEKENISVEFQG